MTTERSQSPVLLSDRLRQNVECAPWVIEVVRELEAERDALRALLQADRDTFHALDCRGGLGYEAHDRIGVRINAIDAALAASKP